MNRKHKGMWREAGKLGMCFSVVPNRNIKAMFSPADKDAALKYILHLSNTQYVINKTKQQKKNPANCCLTLKKPLQGLLYLPGVQTLPSLVLHL